MDQKSGNTNEGVIKKPVVVMITSGGDGVGRVFVNKKPHVVTGGGDGNDQKSDIASSNKKPDSIDKRPNMTNGQKPCSIAELILQIAELRKRREDAVAMQDYLKAHEIQKEIEKTEQELKSKDDELASLKADNEKRKQEYNQYRESCLLVYVNQKKIIASRDRSVENLTQKIVERDETIDNLMQTNEGLARSSVADNDKIEKLERSIAARDETIRMLKAKASIFDEVRRLSNSLAEDPVVVKKKYRKRKPADRSDQTSQKIRRLPVESFLVDAPADNLSHRERMNRVAAEALIILGGAGTLQEVADAALASNQVKEDFARQEMTAFKTSLSDAMGKKRPNKFIYKSKLRKWSLEEN